MTGPEHYREAERLLAGIPAGMEHAQRTNASAGALAHSLAVIIAEAQVHATLALAAATVERVSARGPGDVGRDWIEATS